MPRRERRRPDSEERRSHRRVAGGRLPTLATHLSGASKVTLLDLSRAGVRLETTRHMRPGQMVSLRFSVDTELVTVNAAVVRASIVRLDAEEVRYETGLRLVDEFSCEPLQVALIERRTTHRHTDADDADCPEPFVFTAVDDEHGHVDTTRGWWLAGPRRRRRALSGL